MKKPLMVLIAFGVLALICVFMFISISNREARLRNAINAKQKDNTSEFDNMWKKIQQVAEVPQAKMASLKDIFVSYAQARGANTSGGSLATWVKESVPNVSDTTFENLMNIITASRDSWTQRQKELIDLSREHNNMLTTFPSGAVCSILGRQPIDITIVTSTRTDKAFQTGKDDDVQLFKK
jgi:hypothetical protein